MGVAAPPSAAWRARAAVRSALLCGAVLGSVVLGGASLASVALAANTRTRGAAPHASWPSQGQAAVAIGHGRLAASPDQPRVPIASVAKVMTAYLTLQRYPLSGDQDGFTITITADDVEAEEQDAADNESVVPVAVGEVLTERQLLEALLIPSGNNIAWLLAERLAGSDPAFVARMNAAAGDLGMRHTAYTDPSGFDAGTVSTASDQLLVFRRAMQSLAFRQVVAMATVSLPVAGTVTNYDPLITEGYDGKTGSDSLALGCLSFFTHAEVDGRLRTVIGVVLGQGEGSNTFALVDAAGDAAEQLVASIS